MLHNAFPDQFDILALQEPYINFLGNTRANPKWRVHYPDQHKIEPKHTCTLFLVNTRLSSNSWTPLSINSNDLAAIKIRTQDCDVVIFNIYNDGQHSNTLTLLEQEFQKLAREKHEHPTFAVVLGDFNRHHPMWDEPRNHHLFTKNNLDEAQTLIDMIADYDLQMTLPRHIPTLKAMSTGNLTRVDNVFVSTDIAERILICETQQELTPTKTDHFPIITTIDISPEHHNPLPRRNYKNIDWKVFRTRLEQRLAYHNIDWKDPPPPETKEELDQLLEAMMTAIEETIEEIVPLLRLSPHSK